MVTTHSIKVLGRDLQVKSASAPEHVAEVEALVNAKLAEAGAAVKGGDTQLVVILALMNLAEGCLRARKESDERQHLLETRIEGLLSKLDGTP